jgi:K319-like protein
MEYRVKLFKNSNKPYSHYPFLSQIPESQSPKIQLLPPVANAGISKTVNENTKVMLDGRSSYSAYGEMIVGYQWTQLPNGIPVILTGANTATPTFTGPLVPTDAIFAFSLRVVDNHGAVSTNPAVAYVMVNHHPNVVSHSGATGGIIPGSTIVQPQQQQQQQPIVPNSNAISPPSHLKSFPHNSSSQKGSRTSQNTFPSGVP